MKITDIETFAVGAGWKNWLFVKVHTDKGIHGVGALSEIVIFRGIALDLHHLVEGHIGWFPIILITNFFYNIVLLGIGVVDYGIAEIRRVFEIPGIVIRVGEPVPATVFDGPAEGVFFGGILKGGIVMAGGNGCHAAPEGMAGCR